MCGTFVDEKHFDYLISSDTEVFKPDGKLLLRFVRKAVPPEMADGAVATASTLAHKTTNRGMAAGRYKDGHAMRSGKLLKDGRASKQLRSARDVKSGIVGYFESTPRFPYCRTTAYNILDAQLGPVLELIRHIDGVFRDTVADRHAAQMRMVRMTQPEFVISGTAFTTVTVNENFRTAVHKDQGDLKDGFGVMTCLQEGSYRGGFTVWPQFRVAVDLRHGDVVLADVHEWHANAPIVTVSGRFKRITMVLYYREKMITCVKPTDELRRAKLRRGGLR